MNPHYMFWGSGSGCSFHTAVFILSLSKKIMFVPYNLTTEFDLFQLFPLVYSWWSFTGVGIANKKKIVGLLSAILWRHANCTIIIYGSEGTGVSLWRRTDDVSRWKQRKRRCRCDCAAVDKMATAHCGYVAKSSSCRFSRQSL